MRSYAKAIAHSILDLFFVMPHSVVLSQRLAFLSGRFERSTVRYLGKTLRAGGVMLDVGAHVGYYSIILSRIADTVYAFEPDPENFKLLVWNTRRYPNIIAVQAAVGDMTGITPFFLAPGSSFRNSLIKNSGTEIRVPVWTLDGFAESNHIRDISFIKIDVEGAEQRVLDGARRIRSESHPLIVLEEDIDAPHEGVLIPGSEYGTKVANYAIT